MSTVVRGVAIYLFLLLVFRVSGKRTLEKVTTFDFVLLLIIAEATQQGLMAEDHSLTNALLLIVTLVLADVAFSLLKRSSKRLEWLIDGVPVLLVKDGRLLEDRMDRERIDEEDILAQGRERHGLERLDQIEYAVLERGGVISIVPKRA
jgi:uncharacterized membrane protein YcaP (DUF421 family)